MATGKQKKDEEVRANAASLLYDDMDEGGGLLNDVIVTFKEPKFVRTNYGGKSSTYRPAAHILLVEDDGTTYDDQFWSAGKDTDWVPSDDGHYLVKVGAKSGISKSSNFGLLMKSLMENGFPKDKVDQDITFLDGVKVHLRQQVVADRDKVKSKDGTKEYDATVLAVAEIIEYPWEKKTGAAKSGGGKKKAANKKAQDQQEDGGGDDGAADPEQAAVEYIVSKLAENPEGVNKALLPSMLIKDKNAGNVDMDTGFANKVIAVIFKPGWAEQEGHPWTAEGGTLKLG